jgi:hypothetical protein
MPKYNRGYIKQDLHDSLLLTLVPSGIICMWSGTLATIPTGWALCDGDNGTPDLTAKFVQGVATSATDPGGTGGDVSKTSGNADGASTATSGAGLQVATNAHTHTISDIRPPYYEVAFIMKL